MVLALVLLPLSPWAGAEASAATAGDHAAATDGAAHRAQPAAGPWADFAALWQRFLGTVSSRSLVGGGGGVGGGTGGDTGQGLDPDGGGGDPDDDEEEPSPPPPDDGTTSGGGDGGSL